MASLFYEPSTRTRFSFESAMCHLGGKVLSTENAEVFSSVAKGETLEDTIRVMNVYADIIVLRHYQKGAAARAAMISGVPIINAGDGIGEHPTQALLDVYTIYKELDAVDDVTIALVGDLKNGRTIHSLVFLLSLFKDINFFLVSPPELRLPRDIRVYLKERNLFFKECEHLRDVISEVDVVYQTRVQKERFKDQKNFDKLNGTNILHENLVDQMKEDAIIMHPLPRTEEIPLAVDTNHRAVYFKQTHYGLLLRMALLKMLLG